MLLIRVDLVERALLALVASRFQLEELGRIATIALIGRHKRAITKYHSRRTIGLRALD